jgi:cytolysin-activating lysine-acyltransferase
VTLTAAAICNLKLLSIKDWSCKLAQGYNIPPAGPNVEGAGALQKTVSQVLGEITWLLTQSQIHKNMFLSDLEWFVMPAILTEQFRIWNGPNGTPAAFVTYAFVSLETDARLEAGAHKLAPHEWQSGEILWLMEVVAPFGAVDEIMLDLVKTAFPDRVFKFHITTPDGKRMTSSSQIMLDEISKDATLRPN